MSTNIASNVEGLMPDALVGIALQSEAAFQQSLRRLREQLPPTQLVHRGRYDSYDVWLKAFRSWNETHRDITAVADDSRDRIY